VVASRQSSCKPSGYIFPNYQLPSTNIIQKLPTYIWGHNTDVWRLKKYLLQQPSVSAVYVKNLVTLFKK